MSVYAVILGAGGGSRIGGPIPKQFIELSGKPVIAYTLEKFSAHAQVDHILVVTHPDYIEQTREIIQKYSILKVLDVIIGGDERFDSSYIALKRLECDDDDIIIIQDAVRPFTTHRIIDDSILVAEEHGSAVTAVPTTDTIAEVDDGFVKTVPSRSRFHNFQTPQTFRYRIILDAHEKEKVESIRDITDDVALVIKTGHKVKIVEGDYENIKLTTPADIELAKSILCNRTFI